MRVLKLLALSVLCASPLAGLAQVKVEAPWVRAAVATQKATGAFMHLSSPTATRLVEARSPVAGVVEIHEMRMEGEVMRMRAVAGVDVPAGAEGVALKPGGLHVMLMALKQPLPAGEKVPLTLVFENAAKQRETVEVQAEVRAMQRPGAGAGAGHSMHR